MKLITYRQNGAEHVGALTADGGGVLPLPVPDMNTLIETMTLTAAARWRCLTWSCWPPSPAPGRTCCAWA